MVTVCKVYFHLYLVNLSIVIADFKIKKLNFCVLSPQLHTSLRHFILASKLQLNRPVFPDINIENITKVKKRDYSNIIS